MSVSPQGSQHLRDCSASKSVLCLFHRLGLVAQVTTDKVRATVQLVKADYLVASLPGRRAGAAPTLGFLATRDFNLLAAAAEAGRRFEAGQALTVSVSQLPSEETGAGSPRAGPGDRGEHSPKAFACVIWVAVAGPVFNPVTCSVTVCCAFAKAVHSRDRSVSVGDTNPLASPTGPLTCTCSRAKAGGCCCTRRHRARRPLLRRQRLQRSAHRKAKRSRDSSSRAP